MTSFLDGLPNSVKIASVSIVGILTVVGGLKTGVISLPGPTPTPTSTPTANPTPAEVINVRLNIRNEVTRKPVPNVKVELIYLSGPMIEYADSEGFIDIKILKTNTTKIFLSKDGFSTIDRQLDPNLNIPQDRNVTFYLSPNEKDDSIKKVSVSTSRQDSVKDETEKPVKVSSLKPSVKTSSKISPEEFMQSYYEKINKKDLEGAYSMFSEKRRAKQEEGFEGFRKWWGDKVQRVELQRTRLIRENNGRAEIEVYTSYIINEKKVDEDPIVFRLALNAEKNNWEMLAKDEF